MTTTKKASVNRTSSVKAFWNASSWSGSSCWMNLSPTPTCLSHTSVAKATAVSPQMP